MFEKRTIGQGPKINRPENFVVIIDRVDKEFSGRTEMTSHIPSMIVFLYLYLFNVPSIKS